jgi:hypothetical protein
MSNILVINALKTWISKLDSQVGDTEAEISKRRSENIHAVQVRDDLTDLVQYMEGNDLPESVYRAISMCISWNPYAK